MEIKIEVSARHIHLCKKDIIKLFGKKYRFHKLKSLVDNNYSCKESLDLVCNGRLILKVTLVMPERKKSYIELSTTDCINLEIKPGQKVFIVNGIKFIKIPAIINLRHIHLSKRYFNLFKNKKLMVSVDGLRKLTFENIKLKISNVKPVLHLDTDEGNACKINKSGVGELWYI